MCRRSGIELNCNPKVAFQVRIGTLDKKVEKEPQTKLIARFSDEDVFGLEISVQDVILVSKVQSKGHVYETLYNFLLYKNRYIHSSQELGGETTQTTCEKWS